MPGILSAATDQAAPDVLISFLKAIPDGRYRRGLRYPQRFLLVVAVLGILSGCRSSRDLEALMRPGKRRALSDTPDWRFLGLVEAAKAHIRAKVEYPFRVIKQQCGFQKTRLRGLGKIAIS